MANDRDKIRWTLEGSLPEGVAQGVRALTREEIGVVFQPIVSIATGRTFAQEALVRCNNPKYPNPGVLFEHAVKEGACGRLGRLIREVTFATGGDQPLFVNLHPEELASRWIVRTDDPLGFHTNQVYLEITEAAALSHHDLCLGVLRELRRRTNAKIVIDDFGAGYSNLERVVDLEPSVVKLDLALVRGVHEHARRQIVIRHLVRLCDELGAAVVAEGVETIDELSCVRDLGVGFAQGYLLARPAAPPPVVDWPLATASDPKDAIQSRPSGRSRSTKPPTARASKPPTRSLRPTLRLSKPVPRG